MHTEVFSVYQVGGDPDHLLLVDQGLHVINGSYGLARTSDGNVIIPGSPECRLTMIGSIRGDGIDSSEVLHRFRNGERASPGASMTDDKLLEEIKRRAKKCVHADSACALVYFINNMVNADAPWRNWSCEKHNYGGSGSTNKCPVCKAAEVKTI